jgi:hypothetical protein
VPGFFILGRWIGVSIALAPIAGRRPGHFAAACGWISDHLERAHHAEILMFEDMAVEHALACLLLNGGNAH